MVSVDYCDQIVLVPIYYRLVKNQRLQLTDGYCDKKYDVPEWLH